MMFMSLVSRALSLAEDRWRHPHYVNYMSWESVGGLAGRSARSGFARGVCTVVSQCLDGSEHRALENVGSLDRGEERWVLFIPGKAENP